MITAVDLAGIGCAPTISGSVGTGGRNKPIDVAIIQHLLSCHYRGNSAVDMYPPTGLADAALGEGITRYQRDVEKLAKPGGLALPYGGTVKKLRASAASHWVPYVFVGEENIARFTAVNLDVLVKLVGLQWSVLDQKAQEGVRLLMRRMIEDAKLYDLRWAAYTFATIKAETGIYQPIPENKALWSKSADAGEYAAETSPKDPAGNAYKDSAGKAVKHRYYGRGYVQLTWLKNYRNLGAAIGQGDSLVADPEQALNPDIAYAIASLGMREGRFASDKAGKAMSLSRFISGAYCKYRFARQIINGMDRADEIAGYAVSFEALMLLASQPDWMR